MRLPLQLAVILAICLAGEILHRVLHIPVPGNILGMLILLFLLCFKVIRPEQIENVTKFFLNHLAFFFLPASVGLLAARNQLQGQWILLLLLCIGATIATMAATGRTAQALRKRKEERERRQ